jgi:hypothetical protein
MWKRTLGTLLVATSVVAAPSCSCSDGETSTGSAGGDSVGPGSGSTNAGGQGGADSGNGQGGDVLVGPGNGGSNAEGNGGAGGACAEINLTFEPVIPSVLLLVDQSGSMDEGFGDGESRWEALYRTLMDEDDGVVTELQGSVRFGLALYTDGDSCPNIIDVPLSLDNRDAIDAVYEPEGPEGNTPTGDSIDAVRPGVVSFAEPGPKFIVLCTDGEPDTCEDGDADGRPESLAAAQATFAAGIGLYVISVGNGVGEDHLQQMANAGVGLPLDGPQDAPFWQALDAQGLADAFDTIINGVRSCVLTVDGEIDPEKACEGEVRIDGVPIPCDDPDGWRLNSPSEIELQGAACDAIQEGEHEIDATFPCDAAETGSGGIPG